MKIIKLIFWITVLSSAHILHAQSTPLPMLESTASNIINTLEKNKPNLKHNHQIIYQAVELYLLPHVDVKGMSRSVLGRQVWLKASTAEQQEFTKLFTRLIVHTYANPLAEYTDEKIKFLPIRGSTNGEFMRVNSIIVRSNGQNIPLSYSMVSKNNDWKIYDLSVEGVSLLQSFRSQFANALQNASLETLIAQMHKNNKAN